MREETIIGALVASVVWLVLMFIVVATIASWDVAKDRVMASCVPHSTYAECKRMWEGKE